MNLIFYLSIFHLFTHVIELNNESKSKDFLFDIPDLSIFYEISSETKERVHLETFKTFKTDKILASKNSTNSDYNELIWVSIGSPRLSQVPMYGNKTNQSTSSLFDFNDEHFSIYFEMLTLQDREKLKQAVLDKKGINVTSSSFINLKPSSLICSVKIKNEKETLILYGQVFDFINTPYQIIFDYSIESKQRQMFEEKKELITLNQVYFGNVQQK